MTAELIPAPANAAIVTVGSDPSGGAEVLLLSIRILPETIGGPA
jgi:hypothetical protein